MTDVLFFQTPDGGEIEVENGAVTMTPGLGVATYLSLFGGAEDGEWWANADEPDPTRWLESETLKLLRALAATSGNMRRIEEAVKRDLAWLLNDKIATELEVRVTMPGLNYIQIAIRLTVNGRTEYYPYSREWKGTE